MGQFDKFVKILGNGSKPDRAVGTWNGKNENGGPKGSKVEMVIPPAIVDNKETDTAGKDTNITQAAVNVAKGRKADLASRDLEMQRGELRGNARKRQIKGLSTTTMRLNEATGEAYDTEETKPSSSGRVMPTRKAKPEYVAADVQRQNEDLQRFTDANTARNVGEQDPTGEAAFSRSERAKGSTLRSLNGVTYDLKDYSDYLDTIPANEISSKAKKPYDISEFEPASANTSTPPDIDSRPSTVVPTKPMNTKMVDDRESEIEPEEDSRPIDVQIQHKAVREYDQKSKGPTTVEYGDTLAEKNKRSSFKEPRKSKIVNQTVYKRPDKVYVENDPEKMFGHLNDEEYDFRGEKPDLASTTMREVQPEGPAAPVGTKKVKVVSRRAVAPYDKPTVTKPGFVIPQNVIDTYTGSDANVDTTQAEIENKNIRENRTNPTTTGPYDPNKTPSRDTFGRTPERRATQAAIREERAASLAAEGKTMTTVHPEIMASAKALAATSRFGFQKDDPFFETTQFLDHPAIQEATIAHATGTHHDFSLLHRALGGRAPEIARRREAWFKVATRMLRKNPEEIKGEFDVLTAAVNKGTTPTTVTRKLEQGKKPGITLNGQTPTLAPAAPVADVKSPTRAGTRRMHENTASNIAYQLQQSAKKAHRIMTFEPLRTTTMRLNEKTGEAYDSDNKEELLKNTAQSSGETSAGIAPAGSGFVTVRNKNNPDQPAVTRPFTKKENLNKGNVPTVDDSRSRSGAAQKEGEPDSSSIIERLQKGPKLDESNN